MTDSLKIREQLALILMSDSDEAKRLILFLVYKTIARNKGITVNQLTHLLHKTYAIKRDSVSAAINALSSSELFNCISTWTETKNKVVHLQAKETDTMAEWLDMLNSKLGLYEYEAPQYTLNGKNKTDSDVNVTYV